MPRLGVSAKTRKTDRGSSPREDNTGADARVNAMVRDTGAILTVLELTCVAARPPTEFSLALRCKTQIRGGR